MLDLKGLENRIDKLLEKETKASLEEWLFDKRHKKINKLLGKKPFVHLNSEKAAE
ncbi:hypothetical protein [Brumimicrobium glaciale]|uniref:hypothetical protein n=1 Tax=Brumimicrobium glaciale TaxID=200475 RepID=UPI0013EDA2DD|nr:hypothetical protein [Brumimicrobium glaciale]